MSLSAAALLLLAAAPAALLLHWYLSQGLRRRLRELHQQRERERRVLEQQLREDIGQLLSALHAEALVAQRARRPESLAAVLQISVTLKNQLRRLLRQLRPEPERHGLTMRAGNQAHLQEH